MRHSAVVVLAKSDAAIAGPGPKGHRILRRVPPDGRYPGSSEAIGRHGQVVTLISAALSRSKEAREGAPKWT